MVLNVSRTAIIAAFGLLPVLSAGAASLLNADFESDASGEYGGWKIPATGVWKIVDGAGRNGTRALVYETEDPDAKYAWVTQRLAVEGGTAAYRNVVSDGRVTLRLKGAGSARVDLPALGVDFRGI